MQRDKSNEAKIIKRIIKDLTGIDTSNGVYYTKKELKRGLKMVRDQTIVDMIAEDVKESISRDLDRHFDEMMFGSLMGEDEEAKGVFNELTSSEDRDKVKIFIDGEELGECTPINLSGEEYIGKLKKLPTEKYITQEFSINFKDIASVANNEYIKVVGPKCSNCDSNNLQSRGSFIWCRDCGKVE